MISPSFSFIRKHVANYLPRERVWAALGTRKLHPRHLISTGGPWNADCMSHPLTRWSAEGAAHRVARADMVDYNVDRRHLGSSNVCIRYVPDQLLVQRSYHCVRSCWRWT